MREGVVKLAGCSREVRALTAASMPKYTHKK